MNAMVPPGYVDVTTALVTRDTVNIIGVVVDVFGDAQRTNKSSFCTTFTLKDLNLDNGHHWDGLRIKYYNSDPTLLPPVRKLDIVLIQNITVKDMFNGKTMAIAAQHQLVPWALYRHESDRASTLSPMSGPSPFEPTQLERNYALSLMRRASTVDTTGHQRTTGGFQNDSPYVAATVQDSTRSPPSNFFTLIKDIKERTYVVLIGEIVSIWANDSDKVVIDITDYTSNKGLYNFGDDSREGDPFNYMGSSPKRKRPLGQMTLRVTLWDAHADYVRGNLMLHDFVRLQKVHIKRSRANGTLEAGLHAERYNPNKVNISKIQPNLESDKNVFAFINRKKEYWAKHGKNGTPEENDETPAKSKKRKKQEKREGKKVKETKTEEDQKVLEVRQRNKPNDNIQARNPGVKELRIEDILTNKTHNIKSPGGIEYRVPFQNICYRSKVRVVDYFPPNMAEFAVPKNSKHAVPDDGNDDYNDEFNGFTMWDWRFCLLVESAAPIPPGESRERMPLFVSGADAVYLLCMDPVDLRTNKTALRHLKEKLFILWGDLEERKSKAATECNTDPQSIGSGSCLPFTCCIKEYGVRCSHNSDSDEIMVSHELGCSREDCLGWERRFAMFETTINEW